MKFKIRDAKPEPEEPTLELWLEPAGEGVSLRGGSEKGGVYHILLITERGIERQPYCSNLGLPCEPDGTIEDVS